MCDVIIQQKTEDTTNTTWLTNNATLGILLFIGIERCVVRNEGKKEGKTWVNTNLYFNWLIEFND